jgi:hypothetical protein
MATNIDSLASGLEGYGIGIGIGAKYYEKYRDTLAFFLGALTSL